MKVQVLNDHILVKPIEENIQCGLYIPPVFRQGAESSRMGQVEYCGPRASVNVGDVVLFGKWSGNEVIIDGVQLLVMKARSIFAIK
jgi:chaperonin GroES